MSNSNSQIIVQPGLQFPFVAPCLPTLIFNLALSLESFRKSSFLCCVFAHLTQTGKTRIMTDAMILLNNNSLCTHTNPHQQKNEDLLVFELHLASPASPCSHQLCADGVWPYRPGKRLSSLGKSVKSQYVSAPQRCFNSALCTVFLFVAVEAPCTSCLRDKAR